MNLTAVSIGQVQGNLVKGMVFQEVEIKDGKPLPEGSSLRIARASFSFSPFRSEGLDGEVHNARLALAHSEDPVVLSGHLANGFLKANLYSKSVDVQDLKALFPQVRQREAVTGVVKDLDITFTGPWRTPQINGIFLVERFSYRQFLLEQCPVWFGIKLQGGESGFKQIRGEVLLRGGTITSRRAVSHLQESHLFFPGDSRGIVLDLRGTSTIEGIPIRMALTGTSQHPELKLTSEPPISQEALLLMLTTGKRWRSLEGQFTQGQIPVDVVRDFLDYLIFSATASTLNQHFGLPGVFLTFDANTKTIGVQRTISENAQVVYGIQPPQAGRERPSRVHRLGAEVKVAEDASIAAEGEVEQAPSDGTSIQTEEPRPNEKILLKYKKRF